MPFPAWMMKVIKREMETQRDSPAVMEQHSQTGILKGVDGVYQTPPAGLLGAFEAATQAGSMKGVDGCSQTNQVLVLCEMSVCRELPP